MGDLKDPRWIYAKGLLFAVGAVTGTALLWLDSPKAMTAFLLAVTVWCACRAYYFAFYVIERYVDPGYRFAGLWDFAGYLLRRGAKGSTASASATKPSRD